MPHIEETGSTMSDAEVDEELSFDISAEWAERLCAAYARKQRAKPAGRERRSRRGAAHPPAVAAPPLRDHAEAPTRVAGNIRALYGVSHRQIAAREAELNAQFDERARSGRYPWPAM